jgi:CubicO group peptidase (beta-lactamase class C family)
MSSGLTEGFIYSAPPGTVFLYNTPVYAVTKRVVAAAAKRPIEVVTRDWLTVPAGLTNTSWRERPQTAAFAVAANPTGLVTSPGDALKFGQIILDGGKAADGSRIVSQASLDAMFTRSPTNPAYGRLWWMNGGAYTFRAGGARMEGQLIPAGPTDLVAALGALDRKLYVVPSKRLIVVRMGDAAEKGFDQQLWLRLSKAIA